MSMLGAIHAAAGVVAGAIGTGVTFTRAEPQGGNPQSAYSLGSGAMSVTPAGTMTVRATAGPVDYAQLPENLMGVEMQRFRVPAESCGVFFPARGHRLTINEGADAGAVLLVRHVARSASGSVIDVYAAAVGGSAGLPSAGEDVS